MSELEERLRREIEKWSRRLDRSLRGTIATCERGREMLENARAYASDSKHFLDKGDLIRAFECLVWAWAWLEIGKELDLLKGMRSNTREAF